MSDQKGSALLMVLLMMALILTITVMSNEYWQHVMTRSQHAVWRTQMKWTLLGNEKIVRNQLQKELKILPVGRIAVLDDVHISYEIRDRSDCFNLNSLVSAASSDKSDLPASTAEKDEAPENEPSVAGSQISPLDGSSAVDTSLTANDQGMAQKAGHYPAAVFTHLLINVTGMDPIAAKSVTQSAVEWANREADDSVNNVPGDKDENADRERSVERPVTYAPMLDSRELRRLSGVDQKVWEQLNPWICVLPDNNLNININALSPARGALLAALFTGSLSVSKASRLLSERPPEGWTDSALLMATATEKELGFKKATGKTLVLKSRYFSLSQWVTDDENEYVLRSLLKDENKKLTVIQRRYGMSEDY
ncbi:type II secretion system minor pseudopilin GspK [Erwinia sp. ErVv1]|uniref:type II secretion system minor pseudopilin GspK n=1 Tax=Erwinia sp. ErVv1 TaxID=1603299 RepID=UPI000833C692|nr:type II secretion system minor pseudopilin GspK [Erwinia sp. ErVv1]